MLLVAQIWPFPFHHHPWSAVRAHGVLKRMDWCLFKLCRVVAFTVNIFYQFCHCGQSSKSHWEQKTEIEVFLFLQHPVQSDWTFITILRLWAYIYSHLQNWVKNAASLETVIKPAARGRHPYITLPLFSLRNSSVSGLHINLCVSRCVFRGTLARSEPNLSKVTGRREQNKNQKLRTLIQLNLYRFWKTWLINIDSDVLCVKLS